MSKKDIQKDRRSDKKTASALRKNVELKRSFTTHISNLSRLHKQLPSKVIIALAKFQKDKKIISNSPLLNYFL